MTMKQAKIMSQIDNSLIWVNFKHIGFFDLSGWCGGAFENGGQYFYRITNKG